MTARRRQRWWFVISAVAIPVNPFALIYMANKVAGSTHNEMPKVMATAAIFGPMPSVPFFYCPGNLSFCPLPLPSGESCVRHNVWSTDCHFSVLMSNRLLLSSA